MRGSVVLALVAGMLLTGTINTILNKLQDNTCVHNCQAPNPRNRRYFEQPLWQTVNMFFGEALCLLVYYVASYVEHRRAAVADARVAVVHPDDPGVAVPSDAVSETSPLIAPAFTSHTVQPMTGTRNLLLWIPTLCDMTATTLMNVGLIHISASIYQMLRGSVVLFTGILSVVFLHRRHPLYRWFALVMVFTGVAIVGLSSIVEPSPRIPGADDDSNHHLVARGDNDTSDAQRSSIIGVMLVVLAQTVTASQFVIEEKLLSQYHVPAIKAVGLEGLFGLITTGTLMPILYYAFGKNTGNFFDLPVGWNEMISHAQVLWAGIGIIFSIAFFNWFGLSVTRSISATSRSTIDTCRTIFIWIISLSLGWEHFRWLQVVGFIILIYGTFLFNDVVKPPPFAFCRTRVEDDEGEIVESP
ncbi:hypothetical protein PhCBS80983_g05716 [Powellomyces hirtus]|uniref:EamA domain-containing protein n=1 Tax=Powellomyces hirtus TaxID=109895 RepID=A0A507DTF9_9FUNG|nr:hypothetical protein PhCBS80983_g05716 [Powellomyces hirtus]